MMRNAATEVNPGVSSRILRRAIPRRCLSQRLLRLSCGRPPKHDLSTWTVTDDWPEHMPVTEAEVDVFERGSAISSMSCSGRPMM